MTILAAQQLDIVIGDKLICQRLDLTFNPGCVLGILGANGSGKTTLLHTLANLRRPTSGHVLLNSVPLSNIPLQTLAQQLGVLFQDSPMPWSQTIWDYCRAGRYPHLPFHKKESADDLRIVQQALAIVALDNKQHRAITELSGGEMRRLAIATLLTQTPSIYLLDEPTNHLDLHHQQYLLSYFSQLAKTQGASVCMTLHDVNIAKRYCDQLLLLFPDGQTAQGTPEEVLTADYLMRLYGCRMRKVQSQEVFWVVE